MSEILEGLPGVVCLMDNVLIYGEDEKQHSSCLEAALNRIQSAKITLNNNKVSKPLAIVYVPLISLILCTVIHACFLFYHL